MKKSLLLFMLFIACYSHGQDLKMNIGVIGGPGISDFFGKSGVGSLSHHSSVNGGCGMTLEYKINKTVSVSSAVMYEQKGASGMLYDSVGGVTSFRINYLTIPVLVKAGFGKRVYFYGLAGPYLGIMLNARQITSNPNIPLRDEYFTATSKFKRIEGGATIGIGLKIPIRKYFAFVIEERNNIGLSTTTEFLTGQSVKNFSCLFFMGVTYYPHKKMSKTKTNIHHSSKYPVHISSM